MFLSSEKLSTSENYKKEYKPFVNDKRTIQYSCKNFSHIRETIFFDKSNI